MPSDVGVHGMGVHGVMYRNDVPLQGTIDDGGARAMDVRVEANEVGGSEEPPRSLADVQQAVLAFLQREAGFAQVYTINREGFPVGRTMVAPVNDDWSVDLVQRRVHRRLDQLRRDPHVEVTWVGAPAPGSTNDHPHVYDWGLLVPRVVFLRGIAELMDDEWTVERYQHQTAVQREKGLTKAPVRDAENVRTELIGVRVHPVQVRAEGFGAGPQSFTWAIAEPDGS
jgi:hypothetical protein